MVWIAVFPAIHRFATIGATMAHRILIVDDHPSFRATARTCCSRPMDSRSSARLPTAPRRSRPSGASSPDLVLLDVQLPDMDGFTVANELCRRNGTGPKVVLTSSRDEADYGSIVAICGAAAFVPKGELTATAPRCASIAPCDGS